MEVCREEKNLGRKWLLHTLKSGSEHVQTPPEVFVVSGRQLDFGNEGLIGDSYLVPNGQERAAAKRRFGVTMEHCSPWVFHDSELF